MSYEMCWDETWQRQYPGFYMNDRGMEIMKTGATTWTLNDLRNEETRHRTLRAAKAAADER
jgi:methylmalonyl-CoA mutase N-terminal domain/subunit